MASKTVSFVKQQAIPLLLTVITFILLCIILYGLILVINFLPVHENISTKTNFRDILVGLTIYIKTAVDFAIFIGNMMRSNPGWKNRIAIEVGSAVGNAMGTFLVLLLWTFFKEVPILMTVMIILSSFVLLNMAQESLDELLDSSAKLPRLIRVAIVDLEKILKIIDNITHPLLSKILPNIKNMQARKLSWINLLVFAFTIPFILGLDDFAGYIPLFSIINVFGFSLGVFLGHMLLNMGLFVSPQKTAKIVEHPYMLLVGGLFFIGIAIIGFIEVVKLLMQLRF